jgi:hypothetical protein
MGQGKEKYLDDDGDDDDGNAVIMGVFIKEFKYIEKRLGKGREPAQVK